MLLFACFALALTVSLQASLKRRRYQFSGIQTKGPCDLPGPETILTIEDEIIANQLYLY